MRLGLISGSRGRAWHSALADRSRAPRHIRGHSLAERAAAGAITGWKNLFLRRD